MSERALRLVVKLGLLACASFGALALAACSGDDEGGAAVTRATATVAAPASGAAPGSSTATARSSGTAVVPGGDAAARVAALHGLRCVGSWRNEAASRGGAFVVRVEAGGGGGALSFEVGGAVFGSAGGVFEAPFRVEGGVLVVDTPSAFLGQVRARIGLDGRAEGRLEGMPALGTRAVATLGEYSLVDGLLRFTLRVDAGDGTPVATTVVDAACARR